MLREGPHRIENYQQLSERERVIIAQVRKELRDRVAQLSGPQPSGSEIEFLDSQALALEGVESLYVDVQRRLLNSSDEYLFKLLWRRVGSPIVEGTVTGFSALNTIQSMAAGGSTQTFQEAMQIAARYIAPTTGAITALDEIIFKSQNQRIELAQRLWKATNQTLKNSAFLLQLTFMIVTDVIQAKNHESSTTPVNISNGAATAIILGCLATSLLGGLRVYFLKEEERVAELHEAQYQDPSLFKRSLRFISCNPVTSRVMAFITGAAAVHWLVSNIQTLIGSTTSTVARIIRYYLTAMGGLPAALLGHSYGERPFLYYPQVYLGVLFTQALALILNAYQKFNSPFSLQFWGQATIKEQIYYWAIAFPSAIIAIQAARFGWRWWINKANQTPRHTAESSTAEEVQSILDSGSPRPKSEQPTLLRIYSPSTQRALKDNKPQPSNIEELVNERVNSLKSQS